MWLDYIENRVVLDSIFGQKKPSLESIIVKKITLDYNGPTVDLRFELNDFPIKPPQKWAIEKYNKVDVILKLIDVKSIDLKKWNTSNLCSITFDREGDEIIVASKGDCEFSLIVKWIRIDTISGYQTVPR